MFKRFFRWLGFHVHEWGIWQPVHEYEYTHRYYTSSGGWSTPMDYKAVVLRRDCACGDFDTKTRSMALGYSKDDE